MSDETIGEENYQGVTPDVIAACNPGIRRTVAWLKECGFETHDSGDGKTHEHECDRDHAYVVMVVDPMVLIGEATRLVMLLESKGLRCDSIGGAAPCIQASFDPMWPDIGTLDLMNVDDALLFPERKDEAGT